MSLKKLAIILSHPVQYYSPLFEELTKQLELKVFYAFQPNASQQGKDGFGKAFEWDVDLLSNYKFEFIENLAAEPGSANYKGCDTPILGEKLQEYGATHVVTFGWHLKMYKQALAYCKKNKIPIAVRGDSQLNPLLPFWKKLIKRIYYPFFLNQFNAFLSVGERNKTYLEYYGISERRIIFSPHAINQPFWQTESKLKETTFEFVWVAKFIHKKRPLDVIKAFKELIREHSEFGRKIALKMVGSGELLEIAKEEASDCQEIQFLGFKNQTELKSIYAQSGCLVLSSDYGETWGLVVNEAFASGIPAIVSNACGCSVDLISESSGRVFAWGDLNSLKDNMLEMLNICANEPQSVSEAIKAKNQIYSYQKITESFKQFLIYE